MTRDVSLDEVFTWREDFLTQALAAFGGTDCDASPQTYSDLKERCEDLDRKADPFFEHLPMPAPLNGILVHMVKPGDVPDGVLRACQCGGRRKV
jgi:hypothetical protein